MDIVDTYTTTEYRSTRVGRWGETQKHKGLVELYAPALMPDDWYLVRVIGVCTDGSEVELSKIIVKR